MSQPLAADLWDELCRGLGLSQADAKSMHSRLIEYYSEPHRQYHNVTHIESMLALLTEHEASLQSPATVYLATFFHDAIYDPAATYNEARSASLATNWLDEKLVDQSIANTVAELILATASHIAADGAGDAAWFLDADLAILGSGAEQYDQYAVAIRREYAFVPEADYRIGRSRVLTQFLRTERLFRTPNLFARFECPARENLQRELESLSSVALSDKSPG